MEQILTSELTKVPCSLAAAEGTLRTTDKAVLLHILADRHTLSILPVVEGKATCCIIDGMAMVQSIGKPATCKTFGDLADVFVKVVHSNLSDRCPRVDVAFDHYEEKSVKGGTREKRSLRRSRPIRRRIENINVPLHSNGSHLLT